jgi:1-acyl-sn-glycerol-3-phosphate acyltransferase
MTSPTPNDEQADVEQLADALLAAVADDATSPPSDTQSPDVLTTAAFAFRRLGIDFVRRYNRLDVDAESTTLDNPALFVANHGFGGIFDLNVFATGAALEQMQLERPLTILTHQLAWTLGVGRLIEPLGARPAGRSSAEDAFAHGHNVLVFPGGDVDAAKSWGDRDRIVFGGRSGFARLAMDNNVPIVPVVTAGAGESLLVISSGERLARATRLDKLLRLKAAPVTVSVPWGLSIGAVGMLPYLPLPTKLHTRVLAASCAEKGEEPDDYAARIQTVMQFALSEMTSKRRPLLG